MALLGIHLTATKTTISFYNSGFEIEWSRGIDFQSPPTMETFLEELVHSIALVRNQLEHVMIDCVSITYCSVSTLTIGDWAKEVVLEPVMKTQVGRRLNELLSCPIFSISETKATAYFFWANRVEPNRLLLLLNLNYMEDFACILNGRVLSIPGLLGVKTERITPKEVFECAKKLDHMFNPTTLVLAGTPHDHETPSREFAHEIEQLLEDHGHEFSSELVFSNSPSVFEQSAASPAILAGYREMPSMGPSSRAQLYELVRSAEKLLGSQAVLGRIDEICTHVVDCLSQGNKVLTCGNGGSATDAAHLVEELVGKYRGVRKSFPAINLCADSSILTCIANDFGFENIFSRQIESLGDYGDVLILFSTSGNSENILRAIHTAKQKKVFTIALLGKDGGRAVEMADLSLVIPSVQTERIQELHTFVLHTICEAVENTLGTM